MSPEQILGANAVRKVASETDVFALGVILYQLLTGQHPFQADSDYEAKLLACNAEPKPPRTIRREIPRDLEAICLKCLEKNRIRRYEDGVALAEDLARFLQGRPTLARPIGRAGRVGRWCLRNPLVTGLIALGLVGTALAIAYKLENARRIEAEAKELTQEIQVQAANDLAEERQKQKEESAYFGTLTTAFREFNAGNLARAEELVERCRPDPGRPDLRAWEWHHLRRRLNSDLVRIRVAPDLQGLGSVALKSLSFTPDGRGLILKQGLAIVLPEPVPEGPQRLELDPLLKRGFDPILSLDGRFAANADPVTFSITVTDRANDRPRFQKLAGNTKEVLDLAFSPDGRRLASVSKDGKIRVWDLDAERQVAMLDLPGTGELEQGLIEFDSGGKTIAALVWRSEEARSVRGCRRELTIWDLAEAKPRFPALLVERTEGSAPFAFDSTRRLAFSPDARWIAIATYDRTIRLIDTRTARTVASLSGHSGEISCLAFLPGSGHLVSGGNDKTIRIWDLEEPANPPIVLHAHDHAIKSLAIRPDRQRLASFDGFEIKVWELGKLQGITVWHDRRQVARSVALSPDGERLLRGGINHRGELTLRKVRTGDLIRSQPYPFLHDVGFNPDGTRIVVCSVDPKNLATANIDLWDGTLGVRLSSWSIASSQLMAPPMSARFTPDGKRLVIFGRGEKGSGELRILDLTTGRFLTETPIRVPQDPQILISPDGAELIVHGNIRGTGPEEWVFDLKAMSRPPRRIQGSRVLGFGRDGRIILREIKNKVDSRLELVDAATGAIPARIFEPYLTHFALVPGNRRLATIAYRSLGDLTNAEAERLLLWETRTGREIVELSADLVSAHFAVGAWFSPDGNRLIVGGSQGELYLWDGTPLPEAWPAPTQIKAGGTGPAKVR
jgi:WD40 repeat protein